MPNWPNWNANYPMATWQPNAQYPQPSQFPQPGPTYSGTGSHVQMQRGQGNLLRVTGPESAKAYPMGADSAFVLFDANEPIFYLVSTDDSGFKSMRTFKFEEDAPIEVNPVHEQFDTDGFATKEDLEAVNAKLDNIGKLLEGLVD